jgi:hypothetical protein
VVLNLIFPKDIKEINSSIIYINFPLKQLISKYDSVS